MVEETHDDKLRKTETFLRAKYRKEIGGLQRFSSASFTVNCGDITSKELVEQLIVRKNHTDAFIVDALRNVGVSDSILDSLTIRYTNVPSRTAIRDLKSNYINQTRSFDGIVRRVSEVKSKAIEAVFECSYCSARVTVKQGEDVTYPESKCEICGKSVKWRVVSDNGKYIDYQTIIVQEFPESVGGGDQPKSVSVTLTKDLCSTVIPGNRITVVGTLKLKKVKSDTGLIFEPYINGNSIIVKDETYDNISPTEEELKEISAISKTPNLLDTIALSIAPTVYGNEEVKKGIVLQLFGGVSKTISGSRIRGDIHILMIGDPGIAKSVIMKAVVALLPRGIFTHGYSASKAGLTATAVKDEDGQWVLEAGALVLANGGLCAVDELDKMNDNDREALHGAMEQQEIDIAKAGIVAKLYTRCSLLGAANPKLGRFDLSAPLSQQFNLAPTLLSRFDLIYPLTDTPEKERDDRIAEFILNTHKTGSTSGYVVPQRLLRLYIAYARTINPRLTIEAAEIIKEYYTKVRGLANNMHTVPITARSLEGLIRLSEASARMRLSDTVTPDDANVVVAIVDGVLRKIAYDSKTNTWDIDKVVNRYPKRSRDIIGKITDAIIKHDKDGVSPLKEVVETVKSYGVPEEEVHAHIELLKNETRIYYPKNGLIKLMR